MKVNQKVWKALFTGAGSNCAGRGILTNLDIVFPHISSEISYWSNLQIFFFPDYSGKYMYRITKIFIKIHFLNLKNYISLNKFYTAISVTLSALRFSSLWSRDGVAVYRGEGVADTFVLTEHCVLFALWCQHNFLQTFCCLQHSR